MSPNSAGDNQVAASRITEKVCFVIAPIGDEGSATRKRSDTLFKHVIEAAVRPLGYKAIRADMLGKPGLITNQVISHVLESPLVVADLSGANPNVFYELAIRHAIRKPLIQLIQQGETLPFDVHGMRTIPVDVDVGIASAAKDEVKRQAEYLEANPDNIDSPIGNALALGSSNDIVVRSIGKMLDILSELRQSVDKLWEAKPLILQSSSDAFLTSLLGSSPEYLADSMKGYLSELHRTNRSEDR